MHVGLCGDHVEVKVQGPEVLQELLNEHCFFDVAAKYH